MTIVYNMYNKNDSHNINPVLCSAGDYQTNASPAYDQ